MISSKFTRQSWMNKPAEFFKPNPCEQNPTHKIDEWSQINVSKSSILLLVLIPSHNRSLGDEFLLFEDNFGREEWGLE